jgi:lipopolysaccharide biosynthesis glycosyltransferase
VEAQAKRAGANVSVVCAADQAYVVPLAATVRSAIERLGPERRLDLFVIDDGIRRSSRLRLRWSWSDPRVRVHWVPLDPTLLPRVPVSGHVSRATYLRLLLPAVLPESLARVIYLDSDVVVRRDLSELWDLPFEGRALLAAQDVVLPFIDAEVALPGWAAAAPYIVAARPVANYRELGLDPRAKYFNGGVLLVDLARWRHEGLVDELLRCLRENESHVRFWDQYVLNVVFHGRWGELDLRWNRQSQIFRYPSWEASPFDRETWERARADPWIAHFTSHEKPWHIGYDQPDRELFFDALRHTAFRRFRPAPPRERRALQKRVKRAIRAWLES